MSGADISMVPDPPELPHLVQTADLGPRWGSRVARPWA